MKIKQADNFFKRLKGLLFTKEITESEGLLLKNCKQVHTFGMNYDIGVFYLDKKYCIVGYELLKKNRIGKKHAATKHILEVHPMYIKDASKIDLLINALTKEVLEHE